MPWIEVGAGTQRATSSQFADVGSGALAFPGNVSAASLLVVGGSVWGSGAAPTSVVVTDTRGTTYTVVLGTVNSGTSWRTFQAYGVAPSSGACTVTVNPAGADSVHSFTFGIDEFAGGGIGGVVNGGTTTGDNSGTASDTITTLVADSLILGVMSNDGATQSITLGAGPTQISEVEDNSATQCHAFAFQIATTAALYTFSWTLGLGSIGSNDWAAQTLAFAPGVGAALVGSSTGTGALTAALTTQIPLAATLAGSGDIVALLAPDNPSLVALLLLSGNTSASLTSAIRMASIIEGAGFASGLLLTGIALESAPTATGAVTASLSTQIALDAALLGQASVLADMGVFAVSLMGAVQGRAFVNGDLFTSLSMNALLAQGFVLVAQLSDQVLPGGVYNEGLFPVFVLSEGIS